VNRIFKLFLAWLIILLTLSVIILYLTLVYVSAPGPLPESKRILIEKNASYSAVTDLLYRQEVISHPFIFKILLKTYARQNTIKMGEYYFTRHISIKQIFQILTRGKSILHKFRVRDGETTNEITSRLNSHPLLAGEIRLPVLEGTVKPDTYFFSYQDQRQQLLEHMQKKQTEILDYYWNRRQRSCFLKSKREALILASIIEKETAIKSEKRQVSAVFINRMKRKMRLQSCPTVRYAITLGDYHLDRKLLHSDLKISSKFNTYVYYGLPPTPISCPSPSSIEAALNPAGTNALYFISTGDGRHYFAESLKQHRRNMAKIKAK
jgi:UPF0755 protein